MILVAFVLPFPISFVSLLQCATYFINIPTMVNSGLDIWIPLANEMWVEMMSSTSEQQL